MTGYGKHVITLSDKKINIELRSLNSKGLDLNMRVPGSYKEHELGFRKQLSKSIERGKADFGLYIEKTGKDAATQLNAEVIKSYIGQLKEISNLISKEAALEMALRLPDTLSTSREEVDEGELKLIQEGIDEALEKYDSFRVSEGAVLAKDFETRIANLSDLLAEVEKLDSDRLGGIRKRLEKAVADLGTEVDKNRFEQELIYYLEKFDITEEKVRLKNHLSYFIETMKSKSSGKKLGFISQEIGREINTMGSKANDATLQQTVVQMKDELEKIKEQLLNVL